MTANDVKWFQYLNGALREKYRNPNLNQYGGYNFEPTIFKWIRDTFNEIKRLHGIDLGDYLNIKERSVLEKLVENLGRDSRLTFLNNPQSLAAKEIELPVEFHQTIEQEQAEQPTMPEGTPRPAGAPLGQTPSLPSPPRLTMPQLPPFPTPETPPEQPQTETAETPEAQQKSSQPGKTPPKGSGFNFPRMPKNMPNIVKNAGSNAGIFIKKGTGRAAVAASKGIGTGIGAGGRSALRAGNFGIRFGLNLSNEFSRLQVGTSSKKLLWLLLLFLVLGAFILTVIPGQAAPITTGDISKCTFYRGGDPTPGLQFQNPAIPQLITDTANRVGVPPAIIAGIMRVESPSAFSDPPTSDYITNDYDAHSSGVAYGVMQFTPETFLNVYNNNQAELQALFGKTDVTTNIDPQDAMAPASVFRIYSIKDSITAAAFKVRDDKRAINGDGPWDQTTVYEIASRYYGALEYTGWDSSIQNYGADLWKSYSSCATGDLRQAIIEQFSITMDGFSDQQLQWAWEELFSVSGTSFINLTKGTVITRIDGHVSEQTGCKTINLGNYDIKTTLQIALIHELGHIIDHCVSDSLSHTTEHRNVVYPAEGGISTYARKSPYPGCVGPGEPTEDYAEMITYYLNPAAAEIGPCLGDTTPPNPYTGGVYPLHYELAKKILGPF